MPEQKTDRVKRRMISIYDIDEAAILQIGKDNGISSFSATLRWMLRDWKRMKVHETSIIANAPMHVTEQPR